VAIILIMNYELR